MEKIVLQNLSKSYGQVKILENVDYSFNLGESIAFVGKNGSGKSTMLKVISGLVRPTTGNVIFSKPLKFSYVPEKLTPQKMSARQYLKMMGQIDGTKETEIIKNMDYLAKRFQITEMLDANMQSLSKGTLQKVNVIQTIMTHTDVLLLDEPLSGQDQQSQVVFVEEIKKFMDKGITIFMSCHEPKLVEDLSNRVLTIKNGKICNCNKNKTYVLYLENSSDLPMYQGMKKYNNGYKLKVEEKYSQQLLKQLIDDGWVLKGMYEDDIAAVEI